MSSKASGRLATNADFRAYYGRDPPSEWIGWVGFVGEAEGAFICFGGVYWNAGCVACGFFDRRGDVPKKSMHQIAVRIMRTLKAVGEKAVYVVCDEDIPGAETWLRRLKFLPEPDTPGLWKAEL